MELAVPKALEVPNTNERLSVSKNNEDSASLSQDQLLLQTNTPTHNNNNNNSPSSPSQLLDSNQEDEIASNPPETSAHALATGRSTELFNADELQLPTGNSTTSTPISVDDITSRLRSRFRTNHNILDNSGRRGKNSSEKPTTTSDSNNRESENESDNDTERQYELERERDGED